MAEWKNSWKKHLPACYNSSVVHPNVHISNKQLSFNLVITCIFQSPCAAVLNRNEIHGLCLCITIHHAARDTEEEQSGNLVQKSTSV
jgi:hypothetical protein